MAINNNISAVAILMKSSIVNRTKWDALFDEDEKEWIATKPSLGSYVYPCYSCRHLFYSKKSFLDHINRRAILLSYYCSECRKHFKYYNRCALLLHCRKHFNSERGTINLANLKISLLDISLAGFSKLPTIPYYFDVPQESYATSENKELNAKFYVPKSMDKDKELIILLPKQLLFTWPDPTTGIVQLLSLKQITLNIPKCEFVKHQPVNNLTLKNSEEALKKIVKTEISEIDENIASNFNSNINSNSSDHKILSVDYVQSDKAIVEQSSCNNNYTLPIITKIETVEDDGVKCPECGHLLSDTLKNHFLGSNIPVYNTLKCDICKLLCTSECSLKAHRRSHKIVQPYVCPDCGESFQEAGIFKNHLNNVCYHTVKLVKYKCPGRRCGKIFASNETFGPHFTQFHILTLFKCSVCKKTYKMLEDCENHCLSHKGAVNIIKIYSCSNCNVTDMNIKEREEHVNEHCTHLSRCVFVFTCKSCKYYFRSIATMSAHLTHCRGQKSIVVPVRKPFQNSNAKFLSSKYVSGSCQNCKTRIIFVKSKPVSMCNKCMAVAREINFGKKEQNSEICFCLLCNSQIKKEFKHQHKLSCKYSKPEIVLENLNVNNVSKYQELLNASSNSDATKRSTSNSPENDTPPKKRCKLIKPKKTESNHDLTADGPIEFNGTYKCRLCDYVDIQRDNFHKHIKSHRQISTTYQCMECGECFVVKPSLIKHLMHYHNIHNCEQYFQDNDCFDIGAVKELANAVKAPYLANKVKDNQCKVCFVQFSNRDEHDKHFRSHGMAFLMKNTV